MPFSSFRPVKPDDPPLDPFLVHTLTIRFESRRQVLTSCSKTENLINLFFNFRVKQLGPPLKLVVSYWYLFFVLYYLIGV